ncbi:MAG: methylated-DNA--[protein]-cysteine S-methyltransferase [Saprospiraceae bacterium]|nr:methylated-DNA--[protein]-cysteine S-methyltransferase [Saprospiraceae bacterium]
MEIHNYAYDTIAEAIRFLRENRAQQPSLDEVAEHVFLSKFHFQRLFRQWAGVTPKAFLQVITVEQAKKSLRQGKSTLESAFEAGLSGTGRLHDLFVKLEACTPGEFKERGQGLHIRWATFDTPFGQSFVAETEKGICMLSFTDDPARSLGNLKKEFPNARYENVLGENSARAKHYLTTWELPKEKIGLDIKGTPFQIQVWKALLQIPAAQNVAYQDIAQAINKPKALRAIGTAIGKNPIAYLIPCHRVINANGESGKYHWGDNRKVAINGYERIHFE